MPPLHYWKLPLLVNWIMITAQVKSEETSLNIFITGATGFIGKHLVRRLVAEGHDVRCLVRRSSNINLLQSLGVKLVYGTVNDRAVLVEGMRDCGWLFHLANLYS